VDIRTETPQQRRERFLRLAAEAVAESFRVYGQEHQQTWEAIARAWITLANEIMPPE